MSDLTPREAALRVAVLDALSEEVGKQLKAARADAEAVFRQTGADYPQVNVRLPDGRTVGRVTVKEAQPQVSMKPGALLAWCREHFTSAIDEYVDTAAWDSRDVIEAVKAAVPSVIRERVRPATESELLKEIAESGGFLAGRHLGSMTERTKVAEVTEGRVTGAFAFSDQKGPERRAAIMAAWQAGVFAGTGLGPLGLPPAAEHDGGVEVADPAGAAA